MNSATENAALETLRAAGLLVDEIFWDGKMRRCPVEGKPRGTDGVYIAHADAPVSIWWQNWRSGGDSGTWTAKGESNLTAAEREALKQRMEESRKARKEEAARAHADAAKKAQHIYSSAAECTEHPYLTAKGVRPVAGLKIGTDGKLIVPLRDETGKISTLQFVADKPDAETGKWEKRFLTGGRKGGRFFYTGEKKPDKSLLIAEGIATAISLNECTGLPVLVAFDVGNLLPVAELARRLYPVRKIILCADNDIEAGKPNVGLVAATEAARTVGGLLTIPRYENRKLDFNDLHRLLGADEVHGQVMAAREPAKDNTGLSCVTAHDFLQMRFPEREMLLSPILPRQGLCMLHAQRGIGKTYVSLSVAVAVASGGKIFDRWTAPKPAKVLFIDGEMPARTLQERLASLINGSDSEPPSADYLRIITPDMQYGAMPNLATSEGQEAVEPLLHGIDLVILDNLATLARHGRSNDEESWIPVQSWLLNLRRRGMSALMIHHQGKGGDQRGTSAKEDILDTVIKLARPNDYHAEQGARFEVHLTKARGICGTDAASFEAQLENHDHALFWTTKSIQNAQLEQLSALLDDGYTIRDAAEELGITKSTAGRLKKKLDAGYIDPRISQGTSFSSLEVAHGQ
jgi:putative DNA primase/helicase